MQSISSFPDPSAWSGAPAHVPWSPREIAYARFVRALVLRGRWTDGEAPSALARSRWRHRYTPLDRPSQWTYGTVRQHEAVTDATPEHARRRS